MDTSRIWYAYFTEKVATKAGTDEMLQDLVMTVVHAAADFDMYATGKVEPDNQDHAESYEYYRDIINRLGIPPQAIIDVIDECCPDDERDNLTERAAVDAVEAERYVPIVLGKREDDTEMPAARLLEACEQALTALNTAPRFRVPALDAGEEKMDSYKIASLLSRVIKLAKGEE